MRARLPAVLLVVAAVVPTHAGTPDPAFADTLPPGIADVSGWELVSGDFDTPQLRGGYRFYVNPDRLAMYQLMRYRIQRLPSGTQGGDAALGAERVAYVRRPEVHEPIQCWERQVLGPGPEWRALAPGSAEYQTEMMLLTQVLAIHRAARTGR